jgi:TRAP-type C4-dicarboxylate transport system permease small subunit
VLERLRLLLKRALEAVAIALLTVLAAVVLLGIVARTVGRPLVWYDEVASILLAWLTYYGAALAALHRAHIGFPELVRALPLRARRGVLVVAEAVVIGFFALLAWVGWRVFDVSAGDRLVSLPWVPLQVAESVLPIGAVLFLVAEALSIPAVWRAAAVAPHVTPQHVAPEPPPAGAGPATAADRAARRPGRAGDAAPARRR